MFTTIAVSNFKSIKDRVEINFNLPVIGNHLPQNVYINDQMTAPVVRSIGIYGANASGKSNVLMALKALEYMVTISGDLKQNELIPCYEPYELSPYTKNKQVTLEAEFYSESGTKFSFVISYIKDRIIFESLDYYPSRVKANIFLRTENDTWETIKFGGHYKGGIKRIPFFQNNSYLSKAGNNTATPSIIQDAYNFFLRKIKHLGLKEKFRLLSFGNRETVAKETAKLLSMIDTGITDITVKKIDADFSRTFPDDMPHELKEIVLEDFKYRYFFSHEDKTGDKVFLPLSKQSAGIQKLFELIPLIKSAFNDRKVIIIDELDNSIHPHIVDLIVRLFNDPEVNILGSQLLFSTHNMQLMTPEKMRRDQIFFCEKTNGSTQIYSLDDFDKKKIKTTTNYANWYDEGRFGGVPNINYLKIAAFLSTNNATETLDLSEDDIKDISNGFFE
ncbi:AAA family ATPase [Thorsellia kenyensis]|uniref:ATP/GTP-binding protein n=1 Tax=Thorsellia kenyensis TaxID=1549888 RepID=A0ABV6C730_9GAMM